MNFSEMSDRELIDFAESLVNVRDTLVVCGHHPAQRDSVISLWEDTKTEVQRRGLADVMGLA